MTDPAQARTAAFAGELARYRAVKARLAAALATPCRGAGGPRVDPVLGPEIHVAEDELAEATRQLAEAVARAADQPVVYLVVYDRGGIGWAGTDEERAHEYARNTRSVVATAPIVGDYRAEETPVDAEAESP